MKILPASAKVIKPKRCRACGGDFFPARPIQSACSIACAVTIAQSKKAKAERAAAAVERRQDRAALEQHKKLPKLHIEAQQAVNAYVRWLEGGMPCISCGTFGPKGEEAFTGGFFQAGHYRSRGSASHLRYVLNNIHLQCSRCNGQLGGNVVAYRSGLIALIGLSAVEALENDNAVKKWTREEVRAIRDHFRARLIREKKEAING